jgi:hypothetical protein
MRYLFILLCVMTLFACKQKRQQVNEITKVDFARSGAWSDMGAAISVDSSLTYKYYGLKDTTKKYLYYTGKTTTQFWDTLNRKLEGIHFKTRPSVDSMNIVDIHYFEFIIHWGNKKRRITGHWKSSTDSLSKVIAWLNQSFRKVELHQVADSIRFETTFQYPPKPKVDQIRFPPPIHIKRHHQTE